MTQLKEEFKALQLIHLALFIGIILVSLMFYLFSGDTSRTLNFDMSLLEGAVLVLCFAIPGVFQLSYQKRLSRLKDIKSDTEKWEAYRQLQITRYAVIEGAALLSAVFFYIQGALFFFVLAVTFGFVLYTYKPTAPRVEYETGLKLD